MSFSNYTIVEGAAMIRNDQLDVLKKEKAKTLRRRQELYGKRDSFTAKEHIQAVLDHADKMGIARKDSNESNILARQLLYIMQQTHEVVYPGQILQDGALPINTEGGTGLRSVAYEVLSMTGQFQQYGPSSTDLPEVGASQREEEQKVGVYGAYVGWSQVDSERAARADVGLALRKFRAVREAAMQTKNQIAWTGDPQGGNVKGLFNSTLNPITITGAWAGATPDDILEDWRKVINGCWLETKWKRSDTVIADTDSWQYFTSRLSNVDTTVGEFMMSKLGISAIYSTAYFDAVTSPENSLTADPVIVAYPRDPMVAEFSLPRDVTQFPAQNHGMQTIIQYLMDTAGTLAYRPECFAFATGM